MVTDSDRGTDSDRLLTNGRRPVRC